MFFFLNLIVFYGKDMRNTGKKWKKMKAWSTGVLYVVRRIPPGVNQPDAPRLVNGCLILTLCRKKSGTIRLVLVLCWNEWQWNDSIVHLNCYFYIKKINAWSSHRLSVFFLMHLSLHYRYYILKIGWAAMEKGVIFAIFHFVHPFFVAWWKRSPLPEITHNDARGEGGDI